MDMINTDLFSDARSVIFSPVAFWSLLGVAFLVWLGMTFILLYHWNSHCEGDPLAMRMKKIYIVGSLVLLVSAASFIISL
jgi:hypothetical protein